jgi:hypothetical protein
MSEADLDFARLRDYLAGHMPDNECRKFEDRLQRDPSLARELDLSLRLSAGLAGVRTQDRLSLSGSSKSMNWAKRLGAAAVVACIALLLWLRTPTDTTILTSTAEPAASDRPAGPNEARPGAARPGEAQPIAARPIAARPIAARPIVAHFSFIGTRGLSLPDLELPPSGLIEIRSAPSRRAPGQRYAATLISRESGADRTLAVLHDLSADADGYVRCYADAQQLRPGSYELIIEAVSGTDSLKDAFMFNLRAEPHASP